MKIQTRFTHDKVRFDKTNDVHLVVSLKAPKLDWEAKRPPVCIIPVIDVSGSMTGEKLDFANTQEVDQIVGLAQVGQAQVEAEEFAKKGDFKGAIARMDAMAASLNSRGHDKLGAFAKGIQSRVVSHASYASSQGYLRSSKGYSARGMSVSKMDDDLEREIVASGLGSDFAMSNAAQCSTADSFSAGADDGQKGCGDLASIVGSMVIPGTLAPSASAGTAKAEKKGKPKKGVTKSKSSRW